MIKRKMIIGIVLLLTATANAQVKNGNEAVNKICGCFDVAFKYAETFSPVMDYKYHDRDEISGGTELAFPIEISDKKISIQHLLLVSDSMIVKHWREDWTFENPVIWKYTDTKTWVKQQLKPEQVKGKWTQTVWEVSDEPRYQGYGQFTDLDGEVLWQSTTDAPLPRREYSVRSDYNILNRTNRLHITDSGYIHEQDNKKIIRKEGVDKLLVKEKGMNSYKRITNSECAVAKSYWEHNKAYWLKVENVWTAYLSTHNTIQLKVKVDGKVIHQLLFNLLDDYNAKKVSDAEIDNKIKEAIYKYIE
ncbi:MAG: DUF6607 family protein [Ginsengibacter sp.]